MNPALSNLDGLLWLALALIALVYLQRSLQLEMQAVFLVTTGSEELAVALFQIIFLPGILLHELSHFLVAKLLWVRTGKFSILPKRQADGRRQLGSVEVYRTDIVRESLIGMAPLIAGMLFLTLVAHSPLRLAALWDILRLGQFDLFFQGLRILPTFAGFWLWFYLTFVISSTMTPSPSDRHAWLPLGLIVGALLGLALLAGGGGWMLVNLAPPLNEFLRACALLLVVSVIVHVILIIPLWMLHRLAARAFKRDVRF